MIRAAILLLTFCALGGAASAQSVSPLPTTATIEQVGTLNVATVAQMASSVTLAQVGASNEATIEQVGQGQHTIALRQGGGSVATIFQSGEGNALRGLDGLASDAIQQEGSLLFLTQTGADNAALVHQTGGAYASLTQTGSGNTITAMQTR